MVATASCRGKGERACVGCTFFENRKHTRLFATFLCFEVVVTRCWLGYEWQRVLAMGKSPNLFAWAHGDRLVWLGAAAMVATVLDVGAILWLRLVPGACNEAARSVEEWETLRELCHHSMTVDVPIRVMHALNMPLAWIATALVVLRSRELR